MWDKSQTRNSIFHHRFFLPNGWWVFISMNSITALRIISVNEKLHYYTNLWFICLIINTSLLLMSLTPLACIHWAFRKSPLNMNMRPHFLLSTISLFPSVTTWTIPYFQQYPPLPLMETLFPFIRLWHQGKRINWLPLTLVTISPWGDSILMYYFLLD